jgi:hypothetical protein
METSSVLTIVVLLEEDFLDASELWVQQLC